MRSPKTTPCVPEKMFFHTTVAAGSMPLLRPLPLILALFLFFTAPAQAWLVERASLTNSGAETEKFKTSEYSSISDDGRFVSFSSSAADLVTGDTNFKNDIFVRDRKLATTVRISVTNDGAQVTDYNAFESKLSGDGRFVVFGSQSAQLAPGETLYPKQNIYVHERATGRTSLITKGYDGSVANNSSAWNSQADISGDGRYVVFSSFATNLVAGDTNAKTDIFLYDREGKTTTLISRASDGGLANNSSNDPAISGDGRYIAFISTATNLVAGLTVSGQQIYRYDRETATTVLVSAAADGSGANNSCYYPSLSRDGRFVTFGSAASNLTEGIASGNTKNQIFLRDMTSGTNTLVSKNADGVVGDDEAVIYIGPPIISPDGRYIVFTSKAQNLLADNSAIAAYNAFIYDRTEGTLDVVNKTTSGAAPSNHCISGDIADEARAVTFTSSATNLVPNDTNSGTDVFVAQKTSDAWSIGPRSQLGGWRNDLAVAGNIAAVAEGLSVTLYNIGGDTPQKLSSLPLSFEPTAVAIAGTKLYAVSGTWEATPLFVTADISNTAAPAILGSCTAGCPNGGALAVSGNHAYFSSLQEGAGQANAIGAVDVTDPAVPVAKGNLPLGDGVTASAFAIEGNRLYAQGVESAEKFFVYDLSNPLTPSRLGELSVGAGETSSGLHLLGNQVFSAVGGKGVRIVDVSIPASPAPLALFTVNDAGKTYAAKDVYAAGNLLYVAAAAGGVFVYNVADSASPVLLGSVSMTEAFRVAGSTGGVLALSHGDAAVKKISLSGGAPVSPGGVATPYMASGLLSAGNRLYIGSDGLFVYDASDPASPQLLSMDTRWLNFVPLAATATQLVGLSVPEGGWEKKIFSVIDVTNPAGPAPLGSYTASGAFTAGVVSGTRAFLLGSAAGAGAEIVDFSTPAAPAKTGAIPFESTAQQAIAAVGNIACIGGETAEGYRIHVFDVASSSSPVFKASLTPAGGSIRLRMAGTTLFVSSNTSAVNDIEAFDLTDPAAPQRAGSLKTQLAAEDIQVLTGGDDDPIILLAKPGGSVHTYGYTPASGSFYPGPVCPSPWSHRVTVSQTPNTAGGYTVATSDESYGSYIQEITKQPKSCCLETQVLPAQAAAEGCTAAPTKVDPVECGGTVEVTAKAAEPWVFKEWTGAATGTSPTAQATASGSCSVAIANFWKPTLTLGTGNLNPSYVTEFYGLAGEFDYENGRTNVVANHLTLTANEVDDWLVTGLTFHTSGAGNEKEDISQARLYLNHVGGTLLGTGVFNADNGNISFSLNPQVTVSKSSTVSMALVYDIKPERAFPCNDYRTRIDMGDVSALPVNYPPGQKLPVPPNGAVHGAVSVRMGDIAIVDGNNQYGEPEDPARPLQNAPLEKPLKSRLRWQHPASVNWISYELTSPPANGGFLGSPPPGEQRVEKVVPADGYVEETMTLGVRKGMQNPYWIQAGFSQKGASCYASWAPPVFTAWGIGVELGATSQYDNPNNGDTTFGTFLSNIQAENKFTLTITMAPPDFATVDHVLFSMGGYTRDGIVVTPNQVYEAVFDMAAFQQPQTLLVTVVMVKDGAQIEQTAEYRVKALPLPSWTDTVGRIAHPDSFTREFSGEDGGMYNFAFNYPTNFAWSDYVPSNVGLLGGLNNDLDIEFTANASYKVDETSTFGATVKGKPTILGQEFDLEGGLSGDFDPNFAFQRGNGALRASFAFDLPEKGFSKTFLIYGVPVTAAVDLSGNVEIFIRGGAVLNRQLEFEEITVAPGTTVTGNVTISLSAVFGLAKIAATGSPTATVEIELRYTTASGTTTTWRGEVVVPITVVGSIFWGLGSAELYSDQLGPWTFPAGGASPQAFRPLPLAAGAPSPRFLSASALAADGAGKRMIVWTDDADPEGASPNADLFFRFHNGTAWSETAPLLAANEEWETDPAVIFTGVQEEQTTALSCWTANNGAKTLTTLDAILAAQDIACAFWNGAAWGSPVKIIDDGQADGTVSLAYDAGSNKAVAVWVHNGDPDKAAMNRTAWKLMYAIFDPATGLWTPPQDVPGTPAGGADQMPSITTDGAGNALLVWARDDDGEFYTELSAVTNGTNVDAKNLDSHILWSKWTGTAWSNPEPVATGGEATRLSPSLAPSPDGKGIAVWMEKEPGKKKSLRYAVFDPATGGWSAPALVAESAQFIEEPKAVVDASGKATVLWRGYAKSGKGGGALFSSTGQMPTPVWSEPRQITQDDAIQWQPAAVLDQGNKLLTAWSEYNSATGAPVSSGGFAGGSGMNMANPDPGSAALSGSYSDRPIDTDGDGLIDQLEVTVGVEIVKAGHFEVRAELHKGTRLIAKAALVRNDLTAGNHAFALLFSGAMVGDHGFDGPYLLRNVVVIDRNGTPVRTAFADSPYTTTGNYLAAQFAAGLLALDRDHYTGTRDQAIITLTDPSLNTDANTVQTVAVRVASTRDAKGFPVTLTEAGADTGLFRGEVGFNLLASNPTLGQILVADHDLLQVVHDDAALDYRWLRTAIWTIGGGGDVNGDGQVNMADAVLALQVGAGNPPAAAAAMKEADINGNGRIGAEEALYILQKAAGLR